MAVRKVSISLSTELATALDRLARARDEDRSRLLETLLREHALIQHAIEAVRAAQPEPPRREAAGHRSRLVVKGEVRL